MKQDHELYAFRRHRETCPHFGPGGREIHTCKCPYHVDGNYRGQRFRQSLDTRSLRFANERAANLMKERDAQLDAHQASGKAEALAMVATRVQPARKKLSEAIERFLETYGVVDDQGTFRGDSEYNTFRKYRSSLRFLAAYCESHGIVYLNDDMGEALAGYRRSRTIGSVTWKTERQSLVTFFRFCISRKWMMTNPAKDWSPPRNLKPNEVEPYTIQEERKILAACDHIGGGKYNRSGARYEQLRAKAMVGLLRHTALRISDVAAFERDAVSWDEENQTWRLRVRTQKTGEPVHLPIPERLKMTLDALPSPRNAAKDCPYYFWNGVTSRRALVGTAERTLSAVFKKSGVKGAHAHRYRHTLATRLLGEGATFEQVADILGNSPEVVRI